MIQNNNNRQTAICWSGNDIYFQAGVIALSGVLKCSVRAEFLFIYLTGYTLRELINQLPVMKKNNIVIISLPQLMPLAYFWLTSGYGVCAVFESGTSVDDIVCGLNTVYAGDNVIRPVSCSVRRLSDRDFFLLKYYIQGRGDIKFLREVYGCACSTLQNSKTALARKFGVRKLEHLLLLN